MTEACFSLNGREVALIDTEPTESLLRWLKRQRLNGTKEGCADGDCGACTVALVECDRDGRAQYRAVNSCLLPMGAVEGRTVVTVEALADGEVLHPVQQSMVDCAGSQCGYCTPGFVMSLFCGYYSREFEDGRLHDGLFEGNLCRCTGYQPIRTAATHIAAVAVNEDRFSESLSTERGLREGHLAEFSSPLTVDAALALKAQHPQAAWIAGATDLGVALSHWQTVAPAFIGLDRIAELQTLDVSDDNVRIGAGVPLHDLETRLAGAYPVLDQMLPWFAARQVKNRATLGGNLGTASPIGDLLPVLLALDARVHCRSLRGERVLAIADFFIDYRKTQRADDELIVAVTVPRHVPGVQASYKVAKRQTDDISIVAASFVLARDVHGGVTHVRLAFGGVAAIPRRALRVEEFLVGRVLSAEVIEQASVLLRDEFAPLSDHRGSADYRRSLCANLFAKFVAEVAL